MMTVSRLINSEIYNLLLDDVIAKKTIEINSRIPEVLLRIHENSMAKAEIQTDKLLEMLENVSVDKMSDFIVEILSLEENEDDGGEFPEGEEPDEDDKPKLIKTLPYPKSFAINMLLEYLIIKYNPNALEGFLKAIRIPKVKTFAKELTSLYNKVHSS